MRITSYCFSIILSIFLSGCFSNSYNLATVRGAPGDVSAVSVQKGDNLYQVAKRYDVDLRDLIEVNHIAPPYKIYSGQGLILPKKRIHIVRQGETLNSIAILRNVDVHNLVKHNSIKAPYNIFIGQKLKLGYPNNVNYARKKPIIKPQKPLVVVKEKASDYSYKIVEKPREETKPVVVTSDTGNRFTVPGLKPGVINKKVKSSDVATRTTTRKNSSQKPITKFAWPVKGKILAKYGKKNGGIKNDGINIAASKGTAIKASEAGEVVYCGNAIRGYGNLILIRHRGGWMSAYAHCDRTFVQKGQAISQGKKIATVGATGNVHRAQLHFEIRKRRRTVDPVRYLE